jgi:hypothetical protein
MALVYVIELDLPTMRISGQQSTTHPPTKGANGEQRSAGASGLC